MLNENKQLTWTIKNEFFQIEEWHFYRDRDEKSQ